MIVLEGVSKDFVMKGRVVQALKNVNMCIDDGDFVVIVGKSGSGKSTLLHILGGLLSAVAFNAKTKICVNLSVGLLVEFVI